jgi:hypothetical protein
MNFTIIQLANCLRRYNLQKIFHTLEGRDFISLHDAILDILLNSDTWKSLPIENFFMEEY